MYLRQRNLPLLCASSVLDKQFAFKKKINKKDKKIRYPIAQVGLELAT